MMLSVSECKQKDIRAIRRQYRHIFDARGDIDLYRYDKDTLCDKIVGVKDPLRPVTLTDSACRKNVPKVRVWYRSLFRRHQDADIDRLGTRELCKRVLHYLGKEAKDTQLRDRVIKLQKETSVVTDPTQQRALQQRLVVLTELEDKLDFLRAQGKLDLVNGIVAELRAACKSPDFFFNRDIDSTRLHIANDFIAETRPGMYILSPMADVTVPLEYFVRKGYVDDQGQLASAKFCTRDDLAEHRELVLATLQLAQVTLAKLQERLSTVGVGPADVRAALDWAGFEAFVGQHLRDTDALIAQPDRTRQQEIDLTRVWFFAIEKQREAGEPNRMTQLLTAAASLLVRYLGLLEQGVVGVYSQCDSQDPQLANAVVQFRSGVAFCVDYLQTRDIDSLAGWWPHCVIELEAQYNDIVPLLDSECADVEAVQACPANLTAVSTLMDHAETIVGLYLENSAVFMQCPAGADVGWEEYETAVLHFKAAVQRCVDGLSKESIVDMSCVSDAAVQFWKLQDGSRAMSDTLQRVCRQEAKVTAVVTLEDLAQCDSVTDKLRQWLQDATDGLIGKVVYCIAPDVKLPSVGDSIGKWKVHVIDGLAAGLALIPATTGFFLQLVQGGVSAAKIAFGMVSSLVIGSVKLIGCGFGWLKPKLWWLKVVVAVIGLLLLAQNVVSSATFLQYTVQYGLQFVLQVLQLVTHLCTPLVSVGAMAFYLYLALAGRFQRLQVLPGSVYKAVERVTSNMFFLVVFPLMATFCAVKDWLSVDLFSRVGSDLPSFTELQQALPAANVTAEPAGDVIPLFTQDSGMTEYTASVDSFVTSFDMGKLVQHVKLLPDGVVDQATAVMTRVQAYYSAETGNALAVVADLSAAKPSVVQSVLGNIQQYSGSVYQAIANIVLPGVPVPTDTALVVSAVKEAGPRVLTGLGWQLVASDVPVTTMTASVSGAVMGFLLTGQAAAWFRRPDDPTEHLQWAQDEPFVIVEEPMESPVKKVIVKAAPLLEKVKETVLATGCPIPEPLRDPVEDWDEPAVEAISRVIACEQNMPADNLQKKAEQLSMLETAKAAVECKAEGQVLDSKTGRCIAVFKGPTVVSTPASIPTKALPAFRAPAETERSLAREAVAKLADVITEELTVELAGARLMKVCRQFPPVTRLVWIINRRPRDKVLARHKRERLVSRRYSRRKRVVRILRTNFNSSTDTVIL